MTTLERAAKAAWNKFEDDDQEWKSLSDAERTALILTELAAMTMRGECEVMVEAALGMLPDCTDAGDIRRCNSAALMAAVEEK